MIDRMTLKGQPETHFVFFFFDISLVLNPCLYSCMFLVSLCKASVCAPERSNIAGHKGQIGVVTDIDECGQQQG